MGSVFQGRNAVQNAAELLNALKEKVPSKIDIGPIYTQDPQRRAAYKGDTSATGFQPVERELVFDIDLTDYDDVRNSSSGTGMSPQCWSLMHIAIQVRLLASWHEHAPHVRSSPVAGAHDRDIVSLVSGYTFALATAVSTPQHVCNRQ